MRGLLHNQNFRALATQPCNRKKKHKIGSKVAITIPAPCPERESMQRSVYADIQSCLVVFRSPGTKDDLLCIDQRQLSSRAYFNLMYNALWVWKKQVIFVDALRKARTAQNIKISSFPVDGATSVIAFVDKPLRHSRSEPIVELPDLRDASEIWYMHPEDKIRLVFFMLNVMKILQHMQRPDVPDCFFTQVLQCLSHEWLNNHCERWETESGRLERAVGDIAWSELYLIRQNICQDPTKFRAVMHPQSQSCFVLPSSLSTFNVFVVIYVYFCFRFQPGTQRFRGAFDLFISVLSEKSSHCIASLPKGAALLAEMESSREELFNFFSAVHNSVPVPTSFFCKMSHEAFLRVAPFKELPFSATREPLWKCVTFELGSVAVFEMRMSEAMCVVDVPAWEAFRNTIRSQSTQSLVCVCLPGVQQRSFDSIKLLSKFNEYQRFEHIVPGNLLPFVSTLVCILPVRLAALSFLTCLAMVPQNQRTCQRLHGYYLTPYLLRFLCNDCDFSVALMRAFSRWFVPSNTLVFDDLSYAMETLNAIFLKVSHRFMNVAVGVLSQLVLPLLCQDVEQWMDNKPLLLDFISEFGCSRHIPSFKEWQRIDASVSIPTDVRKALFTFIASSSFPMTIYSLRKLNGVMNHWKIFGCVGFRDALVPLMPMCHLIHPKAIGYERNHSDWMQNTCCSPGSSNVSYISKEALCVWFYVLMFLESHVRSPNSHQISDFVYTYEEWLKNDTVTPFFCETTSTTRFMPGSTFCVAETAPSFLFGGHFLDLYHRHHLASEAFRLKVERDRNRPNALCECQKRYGDDSIWSDA